MAAFDEDKFEDVTTNDTEMPSPEIATMSREDFDAGEEPEFSPIHGNVEEDGYEDEDEDGNTEEVSDDSFYACYCTVLSLAYTYRYFAVKANLLDIPDAEDLFLGRSDEKYERAETLLNQILQESPDMEPEFQEIPAPPSLGDGDDPMGIFINMIELAMKAEDSLTAQVEALGGLDEMLAEQQVAKEDLEGILQQLIGDEDESEEEFEEDEDFEEEEKEEQPEEEAEEGPDLNSRIPNKEESTDYL